MKKKILFIIIIVLMAGGLAFLPQLKSFLSRQPQLAKLISNSAALQNLKQQVLNGGALRSNQDSPDAYLTRAGTIDFTNRARKENGGLPALKENRQLDIDAQSKLQDMFVRQYFEHVSPGGKGPADQAKAVGYQYVLIGENLALGNFKNDQALVDAWMNSPGHRANILNNKYQEIGVAVGQGKFEGRIVWLAVQEFGEPISACPVVDSALKAHIDSLRQDADALLPQLQAAKQRLDSMPEPKNQQEVNDYNSAVAEYNSLVNLYNNKVDLLKSATNEYNAEVQAFNACAS